MKTNVYVLIKINVIIFFCQELEEFCFRFAVNHLTAVTHTTAFRNLEDSVAKDFLLKAGKHGAFKNWNSVRPS